MFVTPGRGANSSDVKISGHGLRKNPIRYGLTLVVGPLSDTPRACPVITSRNLISADSLCARSCVLRTAQLRTIVTSHWNRGKYRAMKLELHLRER